MFKSLGSAQCEGGSVAQQLAHAINIIRVGWTGFISCLRHTSISLHVTPKALLLARRNPPHLPHQYKHLQVLSEVRQVTHGCSSTILTIVSIMFSSINYMSNDVSSKIEKKRLLTHIREDRWPRCSYFLNPYLQMSVSFAREKFLIFLCESVKSEIPTDTCNCLQSQSKNPPGSTNIVSASLFLQLIPHLFLCPSTSLFSVFFSVELSL